MITMTPPTATTTTTLLCQWSAADLRVTQRLIDYAALLTPLFCQKED